MGILAGPRTRQLIHLSSNLGREALGKGFNSEGKTAHKPGITGVQGALAPKCSPKSTALLSAYRKAASGSLPPSQALPATSALSVDSPVCISRVSSLGRAANHFLLLFPARSSVTFQLIFINGQLLPKQFPDPLPPLLCLCHLCQAQPTGHSMCWGSSPISKMTDTTFPASPRAKGLYPGPLRVPDVLQTALSTSLRLDTWKRESCKTLQCQSGSTEGEGASSD